MKFNFTKNKIIAAALIIIVLAVAFWYGGGAPGLQGWGVNTSKADNNKPDDDKQIITDIEQDENTSGESSLHESEELGNDYETDTKEDLEENLEASREPNESDDGEESSGIEARPGGSEGGLSATEKIELAKELVGGGSSPGVEKGSKDYSESQGMVIDSATGKDKYLTAPVPDGKPVPVEPQNAEISDVEYTCTISVRCDTILDNISWLDKEKVELVPEDGVIFPVTAVTFYEGESVFNVLHREMKKAKIHMEFSNTPIYNSVYIEGINNLYEFDCGELSGWMYKVNDWFPNYGASRYQLKDGDIIEWIYTCDLGIDIGGFNAIGE